MASEICCAIFSSRNPSFFLFLKSVMASVALSCSLASVNKHNRLRYQPQSLANFVSFWRFFFEARMTSTQCNFPYEQEAVGSSSKNANEDVSESETLPPPRVVLNPADCELDFTIESDGVVGYGLNEGGFSYCWSGARANVGITRGKYCFGCKVVSEQRVSLDSISREMWHLCRLGVSRGDVAVGSLGESLNSFFITGHTPKIGVFLDFGSEFAVGDTIVCCIDLESKPLASIGFSKNGIWLGAPHKFDLDEVLGLGGVYSPPLGSLPWGSALFPHVLLKNVKVEMQFSVEDGLVPREGFKPWALAVAGGNGVMGPIFSDPKDCEVIMMVGLPGSGKTTWAKKCVKNHPEKRYVLLGMDLIIDKMKVRKRILKDYNDGNFDRWIDRTTEVFYTMQIMAATVPRNYIIDKRNNMYLNIRKDELKPFADFQKIAVVVFPNLEELKIRYKFFCENVEKAKAAKYILPKSKDMACTDDDEYEDFDQVIFEELDRDESQKCLDQMKRDVASVADNEIASKLIKLEL